MSQKSVDFCELHSNEPSDSAIGNEMHPASPLISFEMMNTSGAINSNKSNSLMQHCDGEGELVTAAKSASLPPIN